MKVSIHQPQYMPWLPYFIKIDRSDLFIFLDNVDFQKNGLQNRNKIKTDKGDIWLTVPVKQKLGQKIKDTQIANQTNWQRKHWQTILQFYRNAKYFNEYAYQFEEYYHNYFENLGELNILITKLMMRCLDINTPTIRSSQMKSKGVASDLVLNLCRESEATSYISGNGGKNYLDLEQFSKYKIDVNFDKPNLTDFYTQLYPEVGFVPHLSAIDVIFNCGKLWKNEFGI
jgi:hypothetical protein